MDSAPNDAQKYSPYVAPGAGGGMAWGYIAGALWVAISALCVHLMFSVAEQQEALSRSIAWWRAADQYLVALQDVELVSAGSEFRTDPVGFIERFPPLVDNELATNRLLYGTPLPNQASLDPWCLWSEANAMLGEALKSLRESATTPVRAVSAPAGEVAHHVSASMRLVTGDMADRLLALDASRSWLYAAALFTVLAAGGLIVLNYLGRQKQRALAASSAALAISETRYRNMFQENATIQLVLQPDGEQILDANRAACEFYGLLLPDLTTRRMSEFIEVSPDGSGRGDVADADVRLLRHRLPSGELRDVEVRSSQFTVHGGHLLYVIIHDVTERHRAERALRESELRFRTLAENIPGVVYQARVDSRLTFEYVSDSAEDLTGHPDIAFLSGETALTDLIEAGDRERVTREIEAAVHAGGAFFLEHDVIRDDGRVRSVQHHGQCLEGTAEQGMLIEGTIFDVTGRKRVQEALQAEQVRLGVTLRSMADGVFSVDNDGAIVLMNDAALEITGWPIEKAVGEPLTRVYDVRAENSGARQTARIGAVIRGDDRATPPALILNQRTGGERIVTERSAPIRSPEGEVLGSVFVVRDVTGQRKLEEQLQRAERLDSLGVLAGGIAHDFNNILAGIIGNFSLVRLYLDDPVKREERLGKAEAAAVRARNLTQQLQTLSKGGAPIRQAASLTELVTETAEFALRGSNVRVSIEIALDLWNVSVDRGQISQVIHNLVLNADQAMPGGGALTLTATNVELAADTGLALAPGTYVRIRVRDTGTGIESGAIERIFDPYYTTKESGSGLGLASAHSIVRNHEGALTVASESGAGTTFDMYLPTSLEEVAEEIAPVMAAPRSGASILLMDDDVVIRDVTGTLLQSMGFEVATAATGEQAIELYTHAQAAATPYDLVILDLTVPGALGGRDAMARLVELDPNVRAVVSSGYLNDAAMMTPGKFGFCGILRKPYTRDELTTLIAKALPSSA